MARECLSHPNRTQILPMIDPCRLLCCGWVPSPTVKPVISIVIQKQQRGRGSVLPPAFPRRRKRRVHDDAGSSVGILSMAN